MQRNHSTERKLISLEEPNTIDHFPMLEIFQFIKANDCQIPNYLSIQNFGADRLIWRFYSITNITKDELISLSEDEFNSIWEKAYQVALKGGAALKPDESFSSIHSKALYLDEYATGELGIATAIKLHLQRFFYITVQNQKRCLSFHALENIREDLAWFILGDAYYQPMTDLNVQILYEGLNHLNLLKAHLPIQRTSAREKTSTVVAHHQDELSSLLNLEEIKDQDIKAVDSLACDLQREIKEANEKQGIAFYSSSLSFFNLANLQSTESITSELHQSNEANLKCEYSITTILNSSTATMQNLNRILARILSEQEAFCEQENESQKSEHQIKPGL